MAGNFMENPRMNLVKHGVLTSTYPAKVAKVDNKGNTQRKDT